MKYLGLFIYMIVYLADFSVRQLVYFLIIKLIA